MGDCIKGQGSILWVPGSFLSHSICHTRATRAGQRPDPQNDEALQAGRGHDEASVSPQLASARGALIFSDFSTCTEEMGSRWGQRTAPCLSRGSWALCAARWVSNWEFKPTPPLHPRSHLSQAGNNLSAHPNSTSTSWRHLLPWQMEAWRCLLSPR